VEDVMDAAASHARLSTPVRAAAAAARHAFQQGAWPNMP
jgi:hypothetical protein